MESNRGARNIDKHVGSRIRQARISLGWTQQQLAEAIGVSYQQAHKYEIGINRVSAGRLYEFARVLSVPVSFFYEGAGLPPPEADPHERRALEVVRNLRVLPDEVQQAISALVRNLVTASLPASAEAAE